MKILLAFLIALPIYYAIDFSNFLLVLCVVVLQIMAGIEK